MFLDFNIKKDNVEETAKKFKLLGNPKHLKILLELEEKSLPLGEIHEKIYEKDIYQHRGSTYKALEKLVSAGIVQKNYGQETKKFYYAIE